MPLSNCVSHYINAWKNCLVFSGRINREKFWCFQLINVLLTVIFINITEIKLGAYDILLKEYISKSHIDCSRFDFLNYFTLLFLVFSILPQISSIVKRLHDVGRSGWFTVFYYTPIVNIWIIFLLIKKGEPGINQYGDNDEK